MATEKQNQAVATLVALLSSVRQLDAKPTTIEDNGNVILDLGLDGFPIVIIGKQGGYGLPDVKSYPETGKGSHNDAFPGISARDAALFGDMHVQRQAAGRKRATVNAAPATGAVADVATDTPSAELLATVEANDAQVNN